MVWPKSLKERVRDQVGSRGLTEFVLEAVEAHLDEGARAAIQQAGKEVNQLKWLVQQLADRVAMGGDSDKRLSGLMELELPEWIETKGWPRDMAQRVRPEPVQLEPAPDPDKVVVAEKVERPKPVEPAPEPKKVSADDLLSKVMAKAQQKGVALADIGLKPASEIERPKFERPSTTEDSPIDVPMPSTPVAQEMTTDSPAEKCPTCDQELIDGECWTCF
jgi:hypothetical protein